MVQEEALHRSLLRDTTPYLIYILLVAAVGPLHFGFHLVGDFLLEYDHIHAKDEQAELNAPQDVITCEKKSVTAKTLHASLPQCIQMNIDQFAVVSSIYTLGGLLGALAGGPLCNKYGRLLTMRLTTISFIIGPIFESLAPSIALLSFGRWISGLGSGAALVVVPIYISEIAPPNEKGFFGSLTQIMVNVGILLAQLLGYFLSRDNMWRIILAVASGIGLVQLLGLAIVPESPKWLAEHRSPQRAREILRKMRGRKADLEDECAAWNVDSSADDICMRILNAEISWTNT